MQAARQFALTGSAVAPTEQRGIAGGGMAMIWGWPIALDNAPILPAVHPGTAMCPLGLDMNKGGRKSCSSGTKTPAEGRDLKGGPDGSA